MTESRAVGKNEIDMTTGRVLPKILLFSIPLMLSGVLQLLFNAADVVVVGKYAGDNSLAAVGSVSSLVNLLVNLFLGLSIGSNVLAARYFGAKREKDFNETVQTSLGISIVGGFILMAVGLVFARPMLELMNSPDQVIDLATTYLKIYFLGMPGLLLYNFGSAILRAKGDTKRPLLFLFIAGVINVGLNLLFVIVYRMDVAGVALATIISQYISTALIVICLARDMGSLKIAMNKQKVRQIMQVGLPAGFQGVLFAVSNVIIQSSVNSFGEIVVAGNSAAASIEGFVYVSMNAFSQAGVSFTSQNMGAGRLDRVPRVAGCDLICVTVAGLVLGIAAYVFGNPLLSIYTKTPEAISYGITRMFYISLPYFTCGIMDTFSGLIRGMGRSLLPMVVTMMGVCVFRVVWIFTVFQIPEFHTPGCVYASYPISWVLTTLVHIVCFFATLKRERKKQIAYEAGRI